MSEDLQLINKTENDTGNNKKRSICQGDQQAYYFQVSQRFY